MTGANRSPTQQTMRGLRCQSAPTLAEADQRGLQNALLCQDSASRPVPSKYSAENKTLLMPLAGSSIGAVHPAAHGT